MESMAENKNDSIMDKRTLTTATIIGSICLTFTTSCDNVELTRGGEIDDSAVKTQDTTTIDERSGISLELESDSLAEEIEDIYFQPQEWEEESMYSDL